MPTAPPDTPRRLLRTCGPLVVPAFSVVLGVVVLIALWIGGDPTGAVIGLLVMVGFAALLLALSGRSELLGILREPRREERWAALDLHATAVTGLVLITACVGVWLWEVAHGRDGSPYGQLCALAGLTYLAALAVMRRRG